MSELIKMLVDGTGLSERDILKIVSNAPRRYKIYPIPKRNGGERMIAHPARELKALQRVILKEYLGDLPVHPAAMAYRKGKSIRDNAVAHSENGPIIKMDFKEFFPSIKVRDWFLFCAARGIFKDLADRRNAAQILFHKPRGDRQLRLAIGAPTSPQLSNVLMYEFDARISAMVEKDYVTYTRYADDLVFSAKRTGYLTGVELAVRAVLRDIPWPRLTVNESKTVLATKRYHRQITGLVLANDGAISLGHTRKRQIRAEVHHAMHGRLDKSGLTHLAGLLAFVHSVEPEFIRRLQERYGEGVLAMIQNTQNS